MGPVSFEIADGETVGFLGLNGAGKTTALRILACDLRPSGGSVAVGDVDALADPHKVRQRIGFLPESPPVYQDMLVTDYLHFAGQLRGMSKSEVRERMPKVLDLTDLNDVDHEIIGELSHGFRQRVGVAQAIIHNPTLLILDEPTRGLDPVQIVEMRNLVHELKEDHTVLISSHILTEISQTCDRFLVLGEGRILSSGRVQSENALEVMVRPAEGTGGDARAKDGACDPVGKILAALDGVTEVSESDAPKDKARRYRVTFTRDVRADLARAVVEAGHELIKLDQARNELEQKFLELVEGGISAGN